MNLRKMFKPICIVLSACMLFGGFSSSIIAHSSPSLNQERINEVEPFLEAIESIPDTLLEEGDSNKINQYFRDRGIITRVYNEERGERVRSKRGVVMCTAAIAAVLVTTAIPVAKIGKIKKYIKSLGGLSEAVPLIIFASSSAERLRAAEDSLKSLIALVFEIDAIREHCYD